MNFEPTQEQRLIADTARQFAEQHLAKKAAQRDRDGEFPKEELRRLAELGLLGVNVPEALGGAQAGVVAYSLALSEIAAADASVSVAMAVTNMVAEIICTFGSEEQKQTFVPRLCSGEAVAGAFALSEAQSGSDAASLRTVAQKIPGGYRLSGSKLWITSGDKAGVLVVWARTEEGAAKKGAAGISAFLVTADTPGFAAGRPEHKLGLRGSTTVPLTFDGCELPESALLGSVGEGFKIAMTALDGGRIGIASQAVGVARAALRAATDYAKERRQFGQAIANFQGMQFQYARCAMEIEAARLMVYNAARLKDAGQPFVKEAAMAKLFASEVAERVASQCVEFLGGVGFTREYPAEKFFRDAKIGKIYEGTSNMQLATIAKIVQGELGGAS